MRREYVQWGLVGYIAGAAAGMLLWSQQMRDAKRDLFHRRAVKRLAALGYVGARPSVENARLLRDFTAWESRPALRRRAAALLRRMETHLG
ncbi:MAG TPA: hypothetical protein VFN39_04660 [Gemmatimonadaceae bacterium]|nr:hypothetical protein [Gemmatimonadaceae bacterium]